MDNAKLMALLKERGHEVKSASSTVDNISAESLREEFGPKPEVSEPAPEEKASEPEVKKEPVLPAGAIVRSKEDIERERREREEEERLERERLELDRVESALEEIDDAIGQDSIPAVESASGSTISRGSRVRAPQWRL